MWHELLNKLPRLVRYSLGIKIDNLFTDCLELALLATYASRTEKLNIIQKLSTKLDLLKFFIKVLWELKMIDNKQFTIISAPLSATGKMVGGWLNMLKTSR